MSENRTLHEDCSAVQTHFEIMQGVIQRMAENSRSCKVWCVTLVAATLVLVARTGEPQHALIALVPTLLFLFLDSYYLALERSFIKSQNTFVAKLHNGKLASTDVYRMAPTEHGVAFSWKVSSGFKYQFCQFYLWSPRRYSLLGGSLSPRTFYQQQRECHHEADSQA